MNWMQDQFTTYENCTAQVGYSDEVGQRPLLPICHITQQAHIEIVIDGEGNFLRSQIVPKDAQFDSATTIVPSTEESASRSGTKPEPHPLCDKLQYVAGDFVQYGGKVTSGFKEDPEAPFRKYSEILARWCDSPFSHPKAIAVLKYIEKKQLIKDLVSSGVLYISAEGKFLEKDEVKRGKDDHDIFSVVEKQSDAFVRWKVEIAGELESRVWKDRSLWESWSRFYFSGKKEIGLCLVTGDNVVMTYNHPKYIRREGDRAKIISSNDLSGFTYRGRFTNDKQACGVGLEVSQKAHNALAWLISKQGYQKGDLAVVAWAESGKPVPQPTEDPFTLLFGNTPTEEELTAYTAQEIAEPLKKRIAGYGRELGETENVSVIALDSASKGRLAVIFYRRLKGSEFLQRIDHWHSTCAWLHHYRYIKDPKSGKQKLVPFFGAPAPSDIAEAAYGRKLDERLRNATITRMLPCIVDGQSIPRDLVESTVRRASNRAGLSWFDWNKSLSIACSLYKKYKSGKENFVDSSHKCNFDG
jgi:CRISPR-associated protein Csd1